VKRVGTKTVLVKMIAWTFLLVTSWSVVGPQLSMYQMVRLKQIAVVPTKVVAKRSNNARRVGWETTHRTCRVQPAQKDKPVPAEVLTVVAEHVPKASLVKQMDKKNAMNALLGFFNRKTKTPVSPVKNARQDGANRWKTLPIVPILVASNLKIVATTSIGSPTNFPTKKQNSEPVVTIAHRVGHAPVPLVKRASVLCLGGLNAHC
jgi:hypothetical protein